MRIVDPQVKDHSDVFRVVLIGSCRQTIFPELVEIFGAEAAVKFMDVFGGMTLKIPDRSLLVQAVRDTDIYVTLKRKDEPEVTENLSRKYDIPSDYVRDIYQNVRALHKKLGLER